MYPGGMLQKVENIPPEEHRVKRIIIEIAAQICFVVGVV